MTPTELAALLDTMRYEIHTLWHADPDGDALTICNHKLCVQARAAAQLREAPPLGDAVEALRVAAEAFVKLGQTRHAAGICMFDAREVSPLIDALSALQRARGEAVAWRWRQEFPDEPLPAWNHTGSAVIAKHQKELSYCVVEPLFAAPRPASDVCAKGHPSPGHCLICGSAWRNRAEEEDTR